MTRMSPLWRRAPLRGLRSRGSGLLVVLSLVVACATAASGPVFADLVGQSSLTTVLATVPPGGRLVDAPGLRLVSGQAPSSESQQAYVNEVASIPGLTPPTVTAVSVGPETHSGQAYRPLLRTPAGDVRIRLAAVEDPAAALVVRQRAGGPGVWLPEPAAEQLGVRAGDAVTLLIDTKYADEVVPADTPLPPTVAVRVAGVYAVAGDGRTPADPPGTTAWALRSGGIPADSELSSLRARLVIADVPLAEQIAAATEDDLLWAVESHLEPGLTLGEAQRAAAGIGKLRAELRGEQADAPPGPLRTGVVSGIDSLVAQATALADASTTRAALLATTGTVAGLLALLALLVLQAVERRTELRHGAAVGVGPAPTAGLWALEAALPAALAAVLGLLLAVGVTNAVGPDGTMTPATWGAAGARAVIVAVIGLVLAALVGAVGAALVTRPHAPRTRRVPWVALLVAVAAVAAFAAWSTPSPTPGPLGLAVPALVCAALGAVLALLAGRLLRGGARRASSLPRRPGSAGRWLAVRRVAQSGDEQVVTVAVMALGLGMILFAASGAQATSAIVEDRAAVVAGARTTAMIEGAWALDKDMPKLPTQAEREAGKRTPTATTPRTPDGSMMLWRELVTIPGTFGYQDLLIADPTKLDATATWGSGTGLADARAALAKLADADARGATSPIPVVAVGTSDLAVGDVLELDGLSWREQARVVAVVPTFPGVRARPMLVASEQAVLPTKAQWDPRLAPADENIPPRPYLETWIWSTGDATTLTGALAAAGAPVQEVHTLEQAATNPALVAARTTLPYQGALAVFLAFLAIVMAVVHGRRSRDRNRASDVMLARSGLGSHGLATARRTELLLLVLTAFVAAVLAVLAVAPLGALLLDLDRGAQPLFSLRVTSLGVAALVLVAAAMIVAAWPRRQAAHDEEALRAAA